MAEKPASTFFLTTINHETVFGKTGFFGGKGRESLDNPGVTLRLEKERLLPTINLSPSPISWNEVNIPAHCTLHSTEGYGLPTPYGPYCAEKKSSHTSVSSSNLSLVLQYLLCPRFAVCPCHHPHPSHLSLRKLSCRKATRLAYACLLRSVVSGERVTFKGQVIPPSSRAKYIYLDQHTHAH